jgi:F-type H+-transporting ATPase subunit b
MAAQTTVAADNFLIPNATFIAELVAFVIILWIISKYILPPIRKAMNDRQAMIAKQVEDSEEAKRQLAEAERAYQNALTESRTEAAQIRENARAEAQRTVEDLKAQAQEESARIVARGDEQLASQRAAIVRDLRSEIGTLAVELSEKIVEQRLSDEAQVSATVDAFLAGLESADKSEKQTSGGADA